MPSVRPHRFEVRTDAFYWRDQNRRGDALIARGRHARHPLLHKKETIQWMISRGIRRRPTLPGRFQPSTISVLRLNFCVRDGNRWIPQAIVTGNSLCECLLLPPFCFRRFGHRPASRLPLLSALQQLLSAPSKPHRLERSPSPDHGDFLRSLETS